MYLGCQKPTAETPSQKLDCKGHVCEICGKCQDWRFTGDAESWNWIRNYTNWSNDDWKRWRRSRIWTLYERNNGATCTSVSHGPGSTYDDPVLGGHSIFHTVNVFGSFNINTSHDFLFTGDHIPADHRIVSSTGNLCVCTDDKK